MLKFARKVIQEDLDKCLAKYDETIETDSQEQQADAVKADA